MPLVPDYSWRQTDQRVVLTVSLHRHPFKAVDLVITSRYVKASFSPYCLEVFLHKPINADRATSRPHHHSLQLLLDKCEDGEWPTLSRPLGKEAAAAARQEAMEELRTMLEQRSRDRQAEQTAGMRQGISRQLQLDETERKEQQRLQELIRSDFFSQPLAVSSSEDACCSASLSLAGADVECSVFPATTPEEDHFTDCNLLSSPTRSPPPASRRSGSLTSSAADSSDTAPLTSSAADSSDTAPLSSSSKEDMRRLSVDWSPANRRRLSTESSSGESPEKGFMMTGLMGGKTVRRRVSEDREYDGDGEDHYSSTENVLAMLSLGDTAVGGRRRLLTRKSGGGVDSRRWYEEEEEAVDTTGVTEAEPREDVVSPATRPGSKKVRPSGKSRNHGPAVRAARSITVSYTSRPNNLPARESRDAAPPAGDGEGMAETKVQELLAKAKCLFERGEHSESASLYSEVLEARPDCVQALSNRAAAHLLNKAPHLAVRDASKALSLCANGSVQSQLLCLLRRSAAFAELGQLHRAIVDLEAALELQPDNSAIRADLALIRERLDVAETTETSSWVETEEEPDHAPSLGHDTN